MAKQNEKFVNILGSQWVVLTIIFILFSSGVSTGLALTKVISMPEITKEQWEKTYNYAVTNRANRKEKYDKIINSFENEHILYEARITYLEDHLEKTTKKLDEITSLLNKIDKKISNGGHISSE
jgi:hypothetical protein